MHVCHGTHVDVRGHFEFQPLPFTLFEIRVSLLSFATTDTR